MRPALYNANKIFAMQGRGAWGKFSEGEGGLEGEGVLFQEDSLSLQGLSHSLSSDIFL